jgi:hypothetical protein
MATMTSRRSEHKVTMAPADEAIGGRARFLRFGMVAGIADIGGPPARPAIGKGKLSLFGRAWRLKQWWDYSAA